MNSKVGGERVGFGLGGKRFCKSVLGACGGTKRNLIDIVSQRGRPKGTRSAEEQTEELKNRLDEIDRQANTSPSGRLRRETSANR